MRYFGVTQMCHGHEYRWIYDGATLVKELNLLSEDEIEKQSDSELYFPIGGSNCSATWILELDSDEKAKHFLTDGGDGPDSEEPMLVDIAEYMLTISTDDGSCTQMFLDKFGFKACTLFDDKYGTMEEANQMIAALKEAGYEDFDYEDPFYGENRDMTIQELRNLYKKVTEVK
jgi:hypothetical protein